MRLQHPLIPLTFPHSQEKRVTVAQFSEGFIRFPDRVLLESTRLPLLRSLQVLTHKPLLAYSTDGIG